jgi:L-fuculose-phosphate aldolase
MLLEPERQALCAFARRMEPDGLAQGTSGNLSIRAGELVAVTPSAVEYGRLDPEMVPIVDLGGQRVEGAGAPSTELPIHLAVYRRTRAAAVVHTHSPWATAVSTVAGELPAIHYLLALVGGPVQVAPYATPGSEELAQLVVEVLGGRSAVLLQNHGAVATGPSLERAYWFAAILEWTAALWSRARLLGEPRILTPGELAQAAEALAGYGPGARAPGPEGRREDPGA